MTLSQTRTFPGRFDSLPAISEFVTGAATFAGLDEQGICAVELAVDEAVTNIIQHAYGGEGHGDIECTCRTDAAGLTVILRDQGRPFDPAAVPQPNLHPDLEECTGGGLGFYFIHQKMDEVTFEFVPDSGNTLTMVKRKEHPSCVAPPQ